MKDKDPIDIDSHCTEPVPKKGKQLVLKFLSDTVVSKAPKVVDDASKNASFTLKKLRV